MTTNVKNTGVDVPVQKFPNDKFYYVEGNTNVENIVKTLAMELTVKPEEDYRWQLVAPADIKEVKNKVIIKATTTFGKDFYFKIEREEETFTHLTMQICKQLNQAGTDLDEKWANEPCTLAWYRQAVKGVESWLPIQYWLNINGDSTNIVLRGDPSPDVYPYQNYLTSYAYLGALTKLEDDSSEDEEFNFGITTASNTEPIFSKKYGERTATGITDVCMIANKIGMPMQPHLPAFYTTHAFMDKCNVDGGSRWNNKKYQFSDITLVHPVEMERGKMQNIVVGEAYGVFDSDRLVFHKGKEDEANYKKFKINAPFSFLNNTANNLYAIAIRCYKDLNN